MQSTRRLMESVRRDLSTRTRLFAEYQKKPNKKVSFKLDTITSANGSSFKDLSKKLKEAKTNSALYTLRSEISNLAGKVKDDINLMQRLSR